MFRRLTATLGSFTLLAAASVTAALPADAAPDSCPNGRVVALPTGVSVCEQVFTSDGTWVRPSPRVVSITVLAVGGGGGGGGAYTATTTNAGGGSVRKSV